MGPGLDLTSNKEHDDSVFHIFTSLMFVGKGGKVVRKKWKAGVFWGHAVTQQRSMERWSF